jgi:hypothetical protein
MLAAVKETNHLKCAEKIQKQCEKAGFFSEVASANTTKSLVSRRKRRPLPLVKGL